MGSTRETTARSDREATDPPDEILVRRVQAGEPDAFELLARRYLRPVHAVAASFLRERADVEDAAQEAFLRALESIRRFDPTRPFAPWLYQIVRNVARNRLKWARRHPAAPAADPEAILADRDPTPEAGTERAEIRQLVADAVETLPEQRRTAFRLVEIEGYPAVEVARLMGLSPGAVRAHLHHARRGLRARLAPLLKESEDDDQER